MKLIDLTGKRFNNWVIIKRVINVDKTNKDSSTLWECKCDCGIVSNVFGCNLTTGKSISCGCVRSKTLSILKSSKNAPFNTVLRFYKSGARLRNLQWMLTDEQFKFLLLGNCFYCGVSPSNITKNKSKTTHYEFTWNGVDRVYTSINYTLENCVSCCTECNLAKLDRPVNDFLSWVDRVYNHQKIYKEKK